MDIIINIAIPSDVYRFYMKVAHHLDNCSTDDVIVDALTKYAAMVSEEIMDNHPDASTGFAQS